jgi:NTE family protein
MDSQAAEHPELLSPVRRIPGDAQEDPQTGTALCLSGGGFRAMLFHTGVLWRLNDVGRLLALDRVSSVSGGSIVAGVLALAWARLDFDESGVARGYASQVVEPVRELARHTLDVASILTGLATPATIGERLAAAYRQRVFGRRTLQELPDRPRFIFNATNVGSGALFRFSKRSIADWRVGRIDLPDTEVAVAVACSSAFPPFLSPHRLSVAHGWETDPSNDLATPEHRDRLTLTDGGVYDNLGLETAWKRCRTILVSDAGGQIAPDPDPAGDWGRHMFRVLKVIDNQVRTLRKRQVQSAYLRGERDGAYLGIRSDIRNYGVADTLVCPQERTLALAEIPTRLAELGEQSQERLLNWGYAICDAALRRHLDQSLPAAVGFPYPARGVG